MQQTLLARILESQSQKDKIVFIHESKKISFYQFLHDVENCRHLIANKQIQDHSNILLAVNNKYHFMCCFFAIQSLGHTAVAIDTNNPDQLKFIIMDTKSELLMTDQQIENIDIKNQIHLNNEKFLSDNEFDFESVLNQLNFDSKKLQPSSPALVLYTSGTTGNRKGVLLSHKAFCAPSYYVNKKMNLNSSIIEYVIGGVNHAYALGRVRCVLAEGGIVVFDEGNYNPSKLMTAITQFGCNALSGAASAIALSVNFLKNDTKILRTKIKWVKMGAQGLSTSFKEEIRNTFSESEIFMNYGLSECQRSTLLDFHRDEGKLHTCGRPSPGVELKILHEDGSMNQPMKEGLISLKGPQRMIGYLNRDDLNQELIKDDWVTTSDVGMIDEGGYLIFVGRSDELINIGGEKVSPIFIEDKIRPFLGDLTFAICSHKDDNILFEQPALVIESKENEGFNLKKIIREIRKARLIDNKYLPKEVFFIEQFPRTGTGKVQRKKISILLMEMCKGVRT